MPGSDVVIAWVEPGSRYVMMDAWLDSYSLPIPDGKQSISNISAAAANGLISFFFSRPYKTGDLVNDINFEECFHFIFPVGGGSVDIKQRIVLKHDVTPTVTTQKFCFNACHAKAISSNTTASTTASPKLPSFVSSTMTTSIPVVTITTTTTTPAPSPPPPTTVTSENVNHETSSSSEGESTSNKQNSPASSFNDLDSIISDCKGEWKYPARCTGYGCDYKATWEYLDDDDDILFTLATKHRNKWTGIAFSNDKAMPQTDAIIGLVEDSGRFFLMDTWLRSYAAPSLDPVQNIQNMTVRRENGITSLRFTRKRKTGDKNDYQFSDTNCPYFLFPVNGGVFNAVNKRLRKHESVPLVSDGRICVKSCRPKPPTTVTSTTTTLLTTSTPSTTTTTTTTIRPPTTSTHSVIAKSTHLPPVPPSSQLPKININDFDFSQLGPSVVDLSKFNGKIPDLTQLSTGNTTALNSLLESVNVSGANFPSILKNLAGKLPSNLKNDSTLVSLLNQHSSSTSSISSSFPTPKHTTSISSSTNDSDSPSHKKKKGDESDSRTKATGNESHSYPTPSSPTFSTTTKAPSRGITSKSPKIPSRWSTFRTSTSTSTTTTSTPAPKKGNHGESGDNSDSTGGEGGVDDGEDGEGDEEEIETPPPSVSDNNNNNNNDNLNNVSSNNNSNKSRKKPLLVHESKYVVELKLPKAWKASFVRRQSEEYQKFKEKIEHQVKKELAGQFSALEVKVMDLSSASSSPSATSSSSNTKSSSGGSSSGDEDDKTTTIAKLKLSVMTSDDTSSPSSSNHPKGKTQEVRESPSTTSSSSSSAAKTPVKLQEALNLAIRDGRVGDVAVDSTYLIIRSLDSEGHPHPDHGRDGSYLTDEQLKWTAIIGGVAALIMLVMMQASCMVWRDKKNRSQNLNKDKVIPGSNWKDYSSHPHHHHQHGHHHPHHSHHHASAYSYENFGLADDPDGLLTTSSPLHSRSNGVVKSNHHLNDTHHHNGHLHMNGKANGYKHRSNGYDDRMLPLPPPPMRNGHHNHHSSRDRDGERERGDRERDGKGKTNDRGGEQRHPQSHNLHQLQPDFYFMPHQRRYSGEVVRVFVDYNNLPKS